MTNTPGDAITDSWQGCYDDSWQGLIVPEAFAHPAKMSRGLLTRILRHAKEEGWLKAGDTIVDPFGGIGSTGILGAYEGYEVVCVELEQKFVDLSLRLREKYLRNLEKQKELVLSTVAETGGVAAELAKLEEQGARTSLELGKIFRKRGRSNRAREVSCEKE